MTSTLVDALFLVSLLLPPAVVVAGAILLAVPVRRGHAEAPAAVAHAHAH